MRSEVCLEHFCISNHEGAVPRHIKVALVELPIAPPCHLRLVPPVHLGDVVPLDAGDAVQSHIARKRHHEVVLQAQQLAAACKVLLSMFTTFYIALVQSCSTVAVDLSVPFCDWDGLFLFLLRYVPQVKAL